MNKDTEVDMKEVELNELDLEKQPMTGGEPGNSPLGTEKNGCVKVKVPEESDFKFTGLSKEELMKVAGTPGWVRIRWVLLVLFWLGWVGMLAGAIVIIVQAPRCKPLPEMNWWNSGPLYQIQDVDAFVENDGLKGLVEKIESLNQLKVKGLVVGPLHTVQKDVPTMLDFTKFNPDVGTKEDFENLLDKAHKKGLSVVVDMTPNFNGQNLWFGNAEVISTMEKLKVRLNRTMSSNLEFTIIAVCRDSHFEPFSLCYFRALIGVTEKTSATEVSTLLNTSGVDLLLSGVLEPNATGTERAKAIQYLYSSQNQTSLAWSVGDSTKKHLATLVGSKLVKLYQLLVFSLPGTPVFSYGDEICLEQQVSCSLQQRSCRSFFKTLSDWRGKERSLQHGDFLLLHNSTSSLAFLREWDQSERYLAVLNWGSSPVKFQLNHESLPEQVTVLLSTDPAKHAPEGAVDLKKLELESGQAVLLRFPYSA
uniref:Solute carrier family 3 member 2 n=1 Tax=Scleropages formosus TaxID=113540 RepID=A0A8C9TMY3_SCLFO